jgi:phage recombination protein Bet
MATATQSSAAPETGLVTSSVDPEVAAAMQLYDRLDPLKAALGVADLSVPELQLFAMVAHRTGLDPFTRQIYAIKRAGKVTHQTGIDGYRSVAERTHEYLGSDEPTYETPCPCGQKPEGHPAVARVVVHRAHASGHVVDQTGVARWHELVPPSGQDSMWIKMPFNQLAKCAEAQGLRKAFPRVLGGVYIAEEMAQAGGPENGSLAHAAAQPTARDRLRARRQALEGEALEGDVIEGTAEPLEAFAGGADPEPDTAEGGALEVTAGPLAAAAFTAALRDAGITDGAVVRGVKQELFGEQPTLSDEERGVLAAEVVRRSKASA